jgi:hypothetical protein
MVDDSNLGKTDPPSTPAGWYPDPSDARQQRYWNGSEWSDQIAPFPPPSPVDTAMSPTRSTGTARNVALLSSVGLMVGAWAPWATTALASESGTHGDGRFTGIFGLIAALVLYGYSGKRPGWLTAIAAFAVISVIVAVGDIANVSNHSSNFLGQEVHVVSVGWGLWLTGVSALALAISASSYRTDERRRIVMEEADREEVKPETQQPV